MDDGYTERCLMYFKLISSFPVIRPGDLTEEEFKQYCKNVREMTDRFDFSGEEEED